MTNRAPSDGEPEDGTPRGFVRRSFVTGAAVMLPIIVTLMVLGVVVNFVSQQLAPLAGFITSVTGFEPASEIVLRLVALCTLLGVILLVGAVAEHRSVSEFGTFFDALIARIPGVGSLYRSIDEMSGLLLDDNAESFREVKLVEFPIEGSYALAFLTADTPDIVESAVEREEMMTLFLPMAPNPVMGGYVLHVSSDRVIDVDLTVEEGIQSIVTSGVATGQRTERESPEDVLDQLDAHLDTDELVARVEDLEAYAADASDRLEETARETMESQRSRTEKEDDRVVDGDGDGDESAGFTRGN